MSDPITHPARHPTPISAAAASDDDSWRDFARSALRRLKSAPNCERFFLVEKTPTPPEARRISSVLESLAPDNAIADMLHEDEIEAALEAGEDVACLGMGRDPRILRMDPRPAALQALLRLCRTFPTSEHLRDTLCPRGAITVLETGDAALTAPVWNLLQAGEAFGLSTDQLPYVTSATEAARDGMDGVHDLWGSFAPGLRAALERGRSIVLVVGSAATLPSALRDLSPTSCRLAPLETEVLLEHLRHSHSETRRISEALVRPHLPRDAVLGRLRISDLALALRAETPAAVARQISARLAPLQSTGTPRLADFPMAPELRGAIDQMLSDLRDWQAGRIQWRDVTRGLLLVGPPGSGKTELARLLADEAGIVLHSASVASWHASGDRYAGFIRSMTGFFARAGASSPSIAFIDELDAVGDRARTQDHNSAYTDGVVAALLEQLDGIGSREGVVMLAATNHVSKIDAAIRRPGRFDRTLTLRNPAPDLMPNVYAYHLRGDLPDADLSEVAARSAGMSGADIAALVRSARAAARQARRGLTQADLEVALAAIRQPMSQQLRRRIAVHEAGHAVIAAAYGLGQPKMIAITDGAGIMQHTWADLEGDEASLMAHLTLLMAGREAERLLLGTVSAGAGGPEESDLARASEIAAAMEVSYGLGTDGPLWRATRHCAVDVMADDLSLRARVRARLEAAEKRAMATLVVNKAALQQIAATMGEASVVYGSDLTGLLSGVVSADGSCAQAAWP